MSESFLPPPDGADAVLRAARRRRTAKVSGAATSVLACAVGVVLLVSGPGAARPRPDQLTTSDGPTPSVSVSPSVRVRTPGGSVPSVPPGAKPAASPLDPVLGTPSPGAATPPPTQHRSTVKRVSPITRSSGTISETDLCNGGTSDVPATYCFRALDPGIVHRGHAVRIGSEFCVMPTSSAQTLHLASTREADITLTDGGTTLWQGGEGLHYRTPGPTVTVQPGACAIWTSSWDTRDREGFVVAPGDYSLSVGISGAFSTSVSATITVQD